MPTIAKVLLLMCAFQIIHAQSNAVGQSSENFWVKLGSKYYLIDINLQFNWFEAERFCRRQNSYLVTITNENESNLIWQYLLSKNYDLNTHRFWISGNDLGSVGSFYSIRYGKKLPFTSWTIGQPDNQGGIEHCAHLWKTPKEYGMNDANCETKLHFICELESLPIPFFYV